MTGQALPPTSSSVSNTETSHVPTTHLPVDGTPRQIAALERPDVGSSLEVAFLSSAAQLGGRKRTRVRTKHWPLWNRIMVEFAYFLGAAQPLSPYVFQFSRYRPNFAKTSPQNLAFIRFVLLTVQMSPHFSWKIKMFFLI